jgi:hypothetical protein
MDRLKEKEGRCEISPYHLAALVTRLPPSFKEGVLTITTRRRRTKTTMTPEEALKEMERQALHYAHSKKLELQRELIKEQYRKGNVRYSNEDAAIDLVHDYKNNFCKYAEAIIKENDTLSRQHNAVLNDQLTKVAANNDKKNL